jgi:hypothetical protein
MGMWGHENVIVWEAGQEGRRDTDMEHLQETYLYYSVPRLRVRELSLVATPIPQLRCFYLCFLDHVEDFLRIKDKSTISRNASSLYTLSTYPQWLLLHDVFFTLRM